MPQWLDGAVNYYSDTQTQFNVPIVPPLPVVEKAPLKPVPVVQPHQQPKKRYEKTAPKKREKKAEQRLQQTM
jgi:hypothetical protein